jgi:hypothetical protein
MNKHAYIYVSISFSQVKISINSLPIFITLKITNEYPYYNYNSYAEGDSPDGVLLEVKFTFIGELEISEK